MGDRLVGSQRHAGRQVGVHVTLIQPGVEVSSEASRSQFTSFLAGLKILEFSENGGTTGNVEAGVNRDGLH